MDKERRNFLRAFGAATGAAVFGTCVGAESENNHSNPEIKPVPTVENTPPVAPQSDISTRDINTPLETKQIIEMQPEANPLEPRMSAALSERIQQIQDQLCRPKEFNAHLVIANAEALQWQDNPLVETVRQTFREEIALRRQFVAWTPDQLDWLTDLCVLGQVTAESEWDLQVRGSGTDTGPWQITDISMQQINIELQQPQHTQFDRTDPIISTRNITSFYDYIYRDLRINGNIEEIQSQYDVQKTEFLIPVMLITYNTGRNTIIRSLRTFTIDPKQRGLDVFTAFIDHLVQNNPTMEQHKREYFFKCYALYRIYQEQRRQQ